MKKISHAAAARVAAVVCALTLGACTTGADESPDLAFADSSDTTSFGTTTTLLIAERPDVELPDEDVTFVEFEAAWVCELQRRTFPTPEALQIALDEQLQANGLNRADYDAFRASVNNSQDLRDSILFQYQETCRP